MKKERVVVMGLVLAGVMFSLAIVWFWGGVGAKGPGTGEEMGAASGMARGETAGRGEGTGSGVGAGYKGWVRVTGADGMGGSDGSYVTWNTETGDCARRMEGTRQVTVLLDRYSTGESFSYDSVTRRIHRGRLGLPPYGPDRAIWVGQMLTWGVMLERMQKAYGEEAVQVSTRAEKGLDCYDVTLGFSEYARAHPPTITYWGGSMPTTIGVDPRTQRISEVVLSNGKRRVFTYEAPAIGTIYDVGVPMDAQVEDDRPTGETAAVLERVAGRAEKGLFDGVMVRLREMDEGLDVKVFEQRGEHWRLRIYGQVVAEGQKDDGKKDGALVMPWGWQEAGAEELFKRLAAVLPDGEFEGDGKSVRTRSYDRATGATFFMVSGGNGRRPERVPGEMEFTGVVVPVYEAEYVPRNWLYPMTALKGRWLNTRVGTTGRVEVITAADRPGLVGLKLEQLGATAQMAGTVIAKTEEWIDPAQGDRAVEFVETDYRGLGKAGEVNMIIRRKFGEYVKVGEKWYPGLEVETTEVPEEGKIRVATEIRYRTGFYLGRRLGEVGEGK